MRTTVYISGPISKGNLLHNIEQGIDAYVKLVAAGYAPHLPHLTVYLGGPVGGPVPNSNPNTIPAETWYDVDIPWVVRSQAVLRLPGESVGGDLEVETAIKYDVPVFYNIDVLMKVLSPEVSDPPHGGHPEYVKILDEMKSLHCKKALDYGSDSDPLNNIRASREVGIEPWKGAYLRLKDKIKRLDRFCVRGTLANEGAEDSFLDLAAYALIALVLFREEKGKPDARVESKVST